MSPGIVREHYQNQHLLSRTGAVMTTPLNGNPWDLDNRNISASTRKCRPLTQCLLILLHSIRKPEQLQPRHH